ncbi:MAG: hypothetical protein FJX72_05675 [Armatimonadetes bacterium]|nr:hypothetical protein [Armatimonadota bacterium]
MSITITLTDAQERTLRRAAETRGKRDDELARELLQREIEALACEMLVEPGGPQPDATERANAFRAWAEGHRRDTALLTDAGISRASIYGHTR